MVFSFDFLILRYFIAMQYNYYTDLIWVIDRILLVLSLLLSIAIVIYAAIRDIILDKRSYNLSVIKQSLHNLSLAGRQTMKSAYPDILNKSTPRQFFSIAKDKEFVLLKDIESDFSDYFIASGKAAEVERIAMKSKNKWQRVRAIVSLGYTNSPNAVEIFKGTILDKDEDISYFSMLALGQIKNELSARILLDFLGKHRFSGYKIVSFLEFFPPSIVDEAIKTAESKDPLVRFWAIKLLSKFKPKQYLNKILDLSKDESADVRAAACECLAELGERQSKDVLTECLKDTVWFVRMHAVRALDKVVGKDCISEIKSLINDEFWLVRDSVEKILKEYNKDAAS